jgi:multiple sugar transport system permease protein
MNLKSKGMLSHGLKVTTVTVFTLAILAIFLSPFVFMVFTSLKTQAQISIINAPIWPAAPSDIDYKGAPIGLYTVPLSSCTGFSPTDKTLKSLGMTKKGRTSSTFIDPDNPDKGEFTCNVSWRALDRPWKLSPTWDNYARVWTTIDFPNLLWNTFYYAFVTAIATVVSCTLVAYGFARYRFPGQDFLFVVLISTLFLPFAVTLVPTYLVFKELHWLGTWYPLIVPTFFANAFNVFLLRQYFLTLPRELDEAAMIDGAGPFRILWSVIVPQSYPALVAVFVFHMVYAWNDYFGPLIYLQTNRSLWPISVALSNFNGIYGQQPQLIQAGALMALGIPLLLFLLAQRFFIQGIVVTGVEK